LNPRALAGFWAGFRALLPLWPGLIAFAVTFGVSARAAGLGWLDTQLLSALLFAGGSQFAAVGLIAADAGPWVLISTTAVINLRHVLYGVVVAATTPMTAAQRLLASHLLTDEAFGLHVAQGRGRVGFLLGAGVSLYLVWNAATAVGASVSAWVPDPAAVGLDLLFPLAFLALLVPRLRGRSDVAVAAVAGVGAWLLAQWTSIGVAVVVAAACGAALGAAWQRTARGRP
jgi:predicted branched-subunit amino acid permease